MTYAQCTTAIPKADISFKSGGKGRTITLKANDQLWVQNSMLDQKAKGYVMIGRPRQPMGTGYCFTLAQCEDLFTFTK